MPGDNLIEQGKELCEGLGHGVQLAIQDRLNEAVDLINSRKFNDVISAFNPDHQDLHLSKASFVKEAPPATPLGLAGSVGIRILSNPSLVQSTITKITGQASEPIGIFKDKNVQQSAEVLKETGVCVFDSAIQMPLISIAQLINHKDTADRITEKLTMLKPAEAPQNSALSHAQLIGHIGGFILPAGAAFKVVSWGGRLLTGVASTRFLLAIPGVAALAANPAVQQNLDKLNQFGQSVSTHVANTPWLNAAVSQSQRAYDFVKPVQTPVATAALLGFMSPVKGADPKQWSERLSNAGVSGVSALLGSKLYLGLIGDKAGPFLKKTFCFAASGVPASLLNTELQGIKNQKPLLSTQEYLQSLEVGAISAPFLSLTLGRTLGRDGYVKRATATGQENISVLKAASQRQEVVKASKTPEARQEFQQKLEQRAAQSLQTAKESESLQQAKAAEQNQNTAAKEQVKSFFGNQDVSLMDEGVQEMIKEATQPQNRLVPVNALDSVTKQEVTHVPQTKQSIFNPARVNVRGSIVKDGYNRTTELQPLAKSHLGNAATLAPPSKLLPSVVTGDVNSNQVISLKQRTTTIQRPKTYDADGKSISTPRERVPYRDHEPALDSVESQAAQALVNNALSKPIKNGFAKDGSSIGLIKTESRLQSENNTSPLIKKLCRERKPSTYRSHNANAPMTEEQSNLEEKVYSANIDAQSIKAQAKSPNKEFVNQKDLFRQIDTDTVGLKPENQSPKNTGLTFKRSKEKDQ
jgi:hypothetical protein